MHLRARQSHFRDDKYLDWKTVCNLSSPGRAQNDKAFIGHIDEYQFCGAADGDLLTCGNNDNGQLGVKGAGTSLVPLRVAALDAFSVHHTAVGLSHCLAAVADGMLASWGGNDSGQLGASPRCLPKQGCRGRGSVSQHVLHQHLQPAIIAVHSGAWCQSCGVYTSRT